MAFLLHLLTFVLNESIRYCMSDMHFLFSARYMHGIVFLSHNVRAFPFPSRTFYRALYYSRAFNTRLLVSQLHIGLFLLRVIRVCF